MSKTQNRFTSFADPEEVQAAAQVQAQQQKKAAVQKDAGKKVVIKKAAPVQNTEEFEKVDNAPKTAGGRGGRGARGGRGERRGGDREGGERGGRGGRGERGSRGGERGGRGGRGGRPRTAAVGEDGAPIVDRAERGGHRSRFEGKAREDAHPMDRQDGTGRGRRGDRKGGDRRGGWGGKKPIDEETNAEETKGDAPVEEQKRERAPRVEREPEPVEEEEEVGFTLDDYMAEKAAKSKGLIGASAQARTHEKIQDKTAERDGDKVRVTTINNQITAKDVHAIRPPANANLLGFQAPVDVEFDERGARGRGGRGERREVRQPREGGRKGRGGKLVIDDDAFPAL